MECYEWENNQSYKNTMDLISKTYPDVDVQNLPPELSSKLQEYKAAIEDIFNNSRGEWK
jgi:hypothetical protein